MGVLLVIIAGCVVLWRIRNPVVQPQRSDALTDGALYALDQKWEPTHDPQSNISHYVYRDLNRSGSFDIGDRPMVGVGVRLSYGHEKKLVRWSNIRGFVNFTTSLTVKRADISATGAYRLEVVAPPNYVVSGAGAFQTVGIATDLASRPGLVADNVPEPVGIVPLLTVSGRVGELSGGGQVTSGRATSIRALDPEGNEQEVKPRSDGTFLFSAAPGNWSVMVDDGASGVIRRDIKLGAAPVQLSTILMNARGREPLTVARLVDFEEITKSQISKVPNGTGGIQWRNAIVVHNELYGGEGYINCTASGSYVAYATSGYPIELYDERGFDFVGAYLGVAWRRGEGETLEVTAWRNNDIVARDSVPLSAFGPVWLDAEYRGITRLQLKARHYWQVVIDDVLVRSHGVTETR